MSDESKAIGGSESNIQSTAQAVATVMKEVPIYQDALQPGAKEIGEGLGGLLAAMMAPLQMLGFASRRYVQEFKDKYEEKAAAIPAERLIPPDPIIMGPTLQALTYTAQETNLREMFVSLLASASDSEKADSVHPSFIEMIKQMSNKDALFIKHLNDIISMPVVRVFGYTENGKSLILAENVVDISEIEERPSSHSSSINNLERLGIIRVDYKAIYSNEKYYINLLSRLETVYPGLADGTNQIGTYFIHEKGLIDFTSLGRDFSETCLSE